MAGVTPNGLGCGSRTNVLGIQGCDARTAMQGVKYRKLPGLMQGLL